MDKAAGTSGKQRRNPADVTVSVTPEPKLPREAVSDRPSGLRQVAVKTAAGASTMPPVADLSVHDTIPAPPWHDGMDDSLDLLLGERDV